MSFSNVHRSASNRLLYLVLMYLLFSSFSLSYQAATAKPCGRCPDSSCSCFMDASDKCIVNCTDGNLKVLPSGLDPTTSRMILRGNKISSMGEISSYGELVELDLSNNDIESMSRDAFGSIPRLRILDLSNNNFPEISAGLFQAFPALEEVFLQGNLLTHLDSSIFDGLANLRNITLSGNNWRCTCDLQWMQDLLNGTGDLAISVTVLDADNVLCSSPASLQDRKLSEVDLTTVRCASSYVSCLRDENDGNHSVVLWEYTDLNESVVYETDSCKGHCFYMGYQFATLYNASICLCSSVVTPESESCAGACVDEGTVPGTVCDRTVLSDQVVTAIIELNFDGIKPYSTHEAVEITVKPVYGTVDNYMWDFNDSSSYIYTVVSKVTHKYALAGTYFITVTVSSGEGIQINSFALTVEEPIGDVVLNCEEFVEPNNRIIATLDIGRGSHPHLMWTATSDTDVVSYDDTFMPDGAQFFEDRSIAYLSQSSVADWATALSACKARHGLLAIVDEEDVARFLSETVLRDLSQRIFWIGIAEGGTRGTFFHANERSISSSAYVNWADNEPSLADEAEVIGQCVVFNGTDDGKWYAISCSTQLPFICQYRSPDRATEPKHFITGTTLFGSSATTVLSNLTEMTADALPAGEKAYVLLFPGMWAQHNGAVGSWELSGPTTISPNSTVRLQLYRPKCTEVNNKVRPGCPDYDNQHLTCHTTDCTRRIDDCPYGQQFCSITDTCQSLSSPCSIYGAHPTIPNALSYILAAEHIVDVPRGQNEMFQLISENQIDVHMDDIIGVGFSSPVTDVDSMTLSKLPLLCQNSNLSVWRQNALLVQMDSWRDSGEPLELTSSRWLESVWCDIRMHYNQESTGSVPSSSFLIPTEPGNYTYTVVAFNNVSQSDPNAAPASCNVVVQDFIRSITILAPAPKGTTAEGDAIIYVPEGISQAIVCKVEGGGTDTNAKWDGIPSGTIETDIQETCPRQYSDTVLGCDTRTGETLHIATTNATFTTSTTIVITARNAHSSANITVRVNTAEAIADLKILPENTDRILANIPQVFTGSVTAGTDVTYSWVIDDLDKFTYENQEYNVLFRTPAEYKLSLTAENSVGSVTEAITLTVDMMNKLKDLEFDDLPTIAERNALVQFTVMFLVDINIYYEVQWTINNEVTNDPVVNQPHSGTPPDPDIEQVQATAKRNHTFLTTGEKDLEVKVFNDYDTLTIIRTVDIREPLTSVEVEMTSAVPAVGDALTFQSSASPSTYGGQFQYDWGDGNTNPTSDENEVTHVYTSPGSYTITMTADNGINTLSNTTTITVYERITGLTPTSNGPTELSLQTQITATVTNGSDVVYSFDFGDPGLSPVINSSTPSASTIYTSEGRYNVSVTAANHISSQQEFIEIYVFTLDVVEVNSTEQCYKTNSLATMHAFMPTDVVTLFDYKWTFEDLSSQDVDSNNKLDYTFTTAGQHTVTARVTSKASGNFDEANVTVCVQDEIISASITSAPPVEIGSPTSFTMAVVGGTDVSYFIDYGDGSAGTSVTLPGVDYTYSSTGNFTAVFTARNLVSELNDTAIVAVQEAVQGVSVTTSSQYGTSIAKGADVTYTASTTAGTDLNYTWDFDDGTPLQYGNNPVHTFANVGTFTITVTVSNQISSDSFDLEVTVKEPVTGAEITATETVIRVNSTVDFTASITGGGAVNYYWQVETGQNFTLGTSTFSYLFTEILNYTVRVKAENEVSADYNTIFILSADLILAVDISTDNLVNDEYAARSESTIFEALLDSGEEISSTTAGSTDTLTYDWTILIGGVQEDNYQGSSIITHAFVEIGLYTVKVNVSNGVSAQISEIQVKSIDRIGNISFTMIDGVEGASASGAEVKIQADVSIGTDVEYYWNPSDGSSLTPINNANFTYVYDTPNTYFPYVTVSNVLGNKTDSYELIVQDGITDLVISQVDSFVEFYVAYRETTNFKASVATGTDVSYSWYYVDKRGGLSDIQNSTNQFMKWSFPELTSYVLVVNGSNLISWDQVNYTVTVIKAVRILEIVADSFLVATDSDIQINATIAQGDAAEYIFFLDNVMKDGTAGDSEHEAYISHRFTSAGSYEVTVQATNNVSQVNTTETITVLDAIVNPQISGCCAAGQYIAIGENLTFSAILDSGTNATYTWNITYESGQMVQATGEEIYQVLTEIGEAEITLIVDNVVSNAIATIIINLQEKCRITLSIEDQGRPIYTNENLTLLIETYGTNVTHVIDFGDFSLKVTTQESREVHIYRLKGDYTITVVSSNNLNAVTKNITTSIHKLECVAPSISFVESSKFSKFFRSRSIYVESKVEVNCTAYEVEYTWVVYKQDDCTTLDSANVAIRPDLYSNRPLLVLPALTLEVSNYCFEVSVSYLHTYLSDSAVVLVGVLSTPLTVVISGGTTRFLYYAAPLLLDSGKSFDPDLPTEEQKGISYLWSCSSGVALTEGEYGYDNTTLKDGTCSLGVDERIQSNFTLPGNTLTHGYEYDYTVEASKNGKMSATSTQKIVVVSYVIPTTTITCYSCFIMASYKISASFHLGLQGSCDNCSPTDTVSYLWEVRRMNQNSSQTTVFPVDLLTTTTGDESRYLVVKEGALTNSYTYEFKLKIMVNGNEGYSKLVLAPNLPPYNGSCVMTYDGSTVYVLETSVSFECSNWSDEEEANRTPLVYTILANRQSSTEDTEDTFILYRGTQASYEAYLPLGFDQDSNIVNIKILVEDQLGTSTIGLDENVAVVQGPTENSTTDWLNQKVEDELEKLLKMNDPQDIVDFSVAAITVLNSVSSQFDTIDADYSQRVYIREKIASTVAEINSTTLKDIQQSAAVLKQCVKIPWEMQNSVIQQEIIKRLDGMVVQMAEFVDREGQYTFQKATNDVLDIVGGMIRTVNYVIYNENTANDIMEIAVNGSLNYSENYRREAITTLLNDIDELVTTVLKSKVVGEESVTFRSTVVSITAVRTTPKTLPKILANGGCYYQLPDHIFDDLDPDEEIFAVTKTYDQNPFTFNYPQNDLGSSGFANITSRVPTVEFSFANGTLIAINDLANDTDGNEKRVKLAMTQSSWGVLSNEETLEIASFSGSSYQPQYGLEFHTTQLDPLKTMAVTLENNNRDPDTAVHIMITYNKHFASSKPESNPAIVAYFDYLPTPNAENHTATLTITDEEMASDTSHQLYTFYIEPLNGKTTEPELYLNITNYFNYQWLEINIAVYYSLCLYYDESSEFWTSTGLYPSSESTYQVSVCYSDHLTSFGSFVINPPNIITITDIQSIDFRQSQVALIAVIVIMVLYLIGMIWARRLDLRDIKRASLIPLCGRNGSFKYEITIKTAAGIGSGTTANVGICLYGYDQRSGSRHLARKGAFQRGSVDTMQIAHDVSLGEIYKIKLWHDNTGLDPGWCIDRVMVKDLQKGSKYYFLVNSWLQVYPDDEDETCLEKEIRVATEDELTNFSQIFGSQLSYGWEDAHMWLSVIERPAQSRFTRVQRVTCCVTLLLTFMVFSAFWYQGYDANGEVDVEDTLVGIVRWKDIAVGAIVSIMAFPISLLIICAFKKTKSKVSPVKPWPDRTQTAQTIEILDEIIDGGGRRFHRSTDDISEFGDNYDDDEFSRRQRNQLPGQNEFLAEYLQEASDAGSLFHSRSQTPISNKTRMSMYEASSTRRSKLHKTSRTMQSFDIKDKAWSSDDSAVNLSTGSPDDLMMVTGKLVNEGKTESAKPVWPNRTSATKEGSLHFQSETDLQEPGKFATTSLTENERKPRLRRRNTAYVRVGSASPPNFIPDKDEFEDDDEEVRNLFLSDESVNITHINEDLVPTNKQVNLRRTRVSKFEEDDEIPLDDDHHGLVLGDVITNQSDEDSDESDVPLPDLPLSRGQSGSSDSRASTVLGTSPQPSSEKYLLPHWCIYLNYIICFITMGICIFFIIVYGSKFGPDTTKRWLLSMFIALLESIFIVEPIKVILFAMFLAMITKPLNPDENDNLVDEPLVETYGHVDMFSKVRAPGGFALDKCKKEARKTKRSNKLLLNLSIYIVFLSSVAALASWDRDTMSYYNTLAVKESLFNTNFTLPSGTDGPSWYNNSATFNQVRTVSDIWAWLDQVFAVKIYEEKSSLENQNLNNLLLGKVRLRQQRSALETCIVDETDKEYDQLTYSGQSCLSNGDLQTSSFSPGWNSDTTNLTWIHSAAEFIAVKYWGQDLVYDDSGYSQFLDSSSTPESAQLQLNELQEQNWINRDTSVVFVEFTQLNPATYWFTVSVVMFEMGVTGAVRPSYSIQTVRIFVPSSAFYVDMLFMPLVAIIGILLLVRELRKIKNKKITAYIYFTKWTNWINLVVLALTITLCILWIYKEAYMEEVTQAYLRDTSAFTNFYKLAFYTNLVTCAACVLLAVIIIRAARLLRFIRSWSVFGNTLAASARFLLGATIMLIILILNFAMLGYLVYGQSYTQVVVDFRDFPNSIYAMFRAFRGRLDFRVCYDYSPVFSIFFFFSYYFGIFYIFCRLFAAIILVEYKFEHAKKNHGRMDVPDYMILRHLITRIKMRLGIIKPKQYRPIVRFEGMSTPSSRGSFASIDSFDTCFMPGRISQCSYATGISSSSSDSGLGTPSDHSISVYDYLTLEQPSDRPMDPLHLDYLYDRLESYSFDMMLFHFDRVNELGDEVLGLENDMLKITQRVEQRKKLKSQSREIAVAASSMTSRPNYISPESESKHTDGSMATLSSRGQFSLSSRGQPSLQSQQTLSQTSLNSGRRSSLSNDSRFQTVLQSMFPLDQRCYNVSDLSKSELNSLRRPPVRSRSYTGPLQSQKSQNKSIPREQISSASSVIRLDKGRGASSTSQQSEPVKQRPHSDEGVRFDATASIVSQATHSRRSLNDINNRHTKQSSNRSDSPRSLTKSEGAGKSRNKPSPLALHLKKSAW